MIIYISIMKLICINDSDRPNDIPTSKWIKKGNHYTAVKFNKMNMQAGALGVQLEEIDLSDCFPHTHFLASRFVPLIPVEEKEKENIEELEEELELT
tara:strand:+ start:289 stop:579 length:291 start_codon:yes stop_codon:yes gene_type:complete